MALDVSDAKGDKGILIHSSVEERAFGAAGDGCRFVGRAQIQKVAGDLSFAHEGSLNLFSFFDFLNFNSTHVINHLRFGPTIPDMQNPLEDVHKTVVDNGRRSLTTAFLIFIIAIAY